LVYISHKVKNNNQKNALKRPKVQNASPLKKRIQSSVGTFQTEMAFKYVDAPKEY